MEVVFIGAVIIASLIAISGYMRNAIAARVKSGADSFSPLLANPQHMAAAKVRCQESTETQLGSSPGYTRTSFTETSKQTESGQGSVGPLANCDPGLPEPN